jgi:hypothetical protein
VVSPAAENSRRKTTMQGQAVRRATIAHRLGFACGTGLVTFRGSVRVSLPTPLPVRHFDGAPDGPRVFRVCLTTFGSPLRL